MDIDEIIAEVSGLPGIVAWTPDEDSGAPEIAWGDTFLFYSPDGDVAGTRRQPFATVVTKDYTGFDEASRLDRPGVFRLNIAVGRTALRTLLGHDPRQSDPSTGNAVDHAAFDRFVPHPVYAAQGWVAVVNPGPATEVQIRDLLRQAYDLDVWRYHRRVAAPDGES